MRLNLLITICKALSFSIYVVVRFVLRYRYNVLETNLKKSFPDKSEAEIKALITTYYKHLGDLVVEPLLFTFATANLRKELATYTNKELLDQLYHDHKHAVVLASHHGNWEYLINLPQEVDFQVYTAYSPISNSRIDRLVHKMRSMLGVMVILKNAFYRKALSFLKSKGDPALAVVIADQRPAPGSVKYTIDFLGQSTNVQIGAERLALASNAAVLYLQCTQVAKFHYNYTFHLLTEAPALCRPLEITKKYYRMMENDIIAQPGNWLWSHKRWKPVIG